MYGNARKCHPTKKKKKTITSKEEIKNKNLLVKKKKKEIGKMIIKAFSIEIENKKMRARMKIHIQ